MSFYNRDQTKCANGARCHSCGEVYEGTCSAARKSFHCKDTAHTSKSPSCPERKRQLEALVLMMRDFLTYWPVIRIVNGLSANRIQYITNSYAQIVQAPRSHMASASGKFRGSYVINMKSFQNTDIDSSYLHAESQNNRRGISQQRLVQLPLSVPSEASNALHRHLLNYFPGQKLHYNQVTLAHGGSYSTPAQNSKHKRYTFPR